MKTKFKYGDRVRIIIAGFYEGATGTVIGTGDKSAHQFSVRLDASSEPVFFMENALEKIPGGMHD